MADPGYDILCVSMVAVADARIVSIPVELFCRVLHRMYISAHDAVIEARMLVILTVVDSGLSSWSCVVTKGHQGIGYYQNWPISVLYFKKS